MSDIRFVKKSLREKYKAIRNGMTAEMRQKADESITNCFIRLSTFSECDTILLYVSVGSEVSTSRLMEHCFECGKTVAVPKCEKKGYMRFYAVDSKESLTPGMFGIPEPPDEADKLITDFSRSVCVVPGLAFDRFGSRLGYGGGYYDRFLSGYPGVAVGFCRRSCVCENALPRGKYDYVFSSFITEKGVVVCGGMR